MKKLIIILLISTSVVACKKPSDPTQQIQRTVPATYTVAVIDTAGTGQFGQISPLTTTVKSGNTATIIITPNTGCRVNSVLINGIATAITDTITIKSVTSNVNVQITLTDSLTKQRLALLNQYITGVGQKTANWYDQVDSSRVHAAIAPFGVFTSVPIPTCAKDSYNVLYVGTNGAANTYEEHAGANPCDTNKAGALIGHGTWKFTYNGKGLTVFESSGKIDNDEIISLTPTTFWTVLTNYQPTPGGFIYDFEDIAAHSPPH